MAIQGNDVFFAKTRPNATIPTKRDEDGWYDLYFAPKTIPENNVINFVLQPFHTYLVPTGIASAFSPLYRATIEERGSTGSIGLKISAGKIDSGFRGEWFVALYNANNKPVEITNTIDKTEITEDFIRYPYSKAIAQFCFEEVPVMSISEIDYDSLKEFKSDRGDGQLGSSNK